MPAGDLPLLLHGDAATPLRIRDLSRAGVAFWSETPLPVMTRVRFAIEIPRPGAAPELARGEGVVVRCERVAPAFEHYEVAIFFSDVDPAGRDAVEAFLAARLALRR